eukprot:scaffold346_cov347-Pavlova_lutheri.AAC.60
MVDRSRLTPLTWWCDESRCKIHCEGVGLVVIVGLSVSTAWEPFVWRVPGLSWTMLYTQGRGITSNKLDRLPAGSNPNSDPEDGSFFSRWVVWFAPTVTTVVGLGPREEFRFGANPKFGSKRLPVVMCPLFSGSRSLDKGTTRDGPRCLSSAVHVPFSTFRISREGWDASHSQLRGRPWLCPFFLERAIHHV